MTTVWELIVVLNKIVINVLTMLFYGTFLLTYFKEGGRERERERHRLVTLLTYTFIDVFL